MQAVHSPQKLNETTTWSPSCRLRDAAADLFDDAGAFVAEQAWQRERSDLVLHAEVGVADPGGDNTHEDLVVAGFVDDDVAQLERRPLRCSDRALWRWWCSTGAPRSSGGLGGTGHSQVRGARRTGAAGEPGRDGGELTVGRPLHDDVLNERDRGSRRAGRRTSRRRRGRQHGHRPRGIAAKGSPRRGCGDLAR